MRALRPSLPLVMLGIAMVLGVVGSVAHAQLTISGTAIERFVGTYAYVGGDEDIEALDRAIDEVVDQMNWFIRGIARRRLRAPNMPSKEVTVALREGRIYIIRPGQPEVSAPANGRPITWRHPTDGDVFQVSHGIDDRGELYQRFEGERSVSRNRFVLSKDDTLLTIHTVITADRLPAPLRFKMTYRRLAARVPAAINPDAERDSAEDPRGSSRQAQSAGPPSPR